MTEQRLAELEALAEAATKAEYIIVTPPFDNHGEGELLIEHRLLPPEVLVLTDALPEALADVRRLLADIEVLQVIERDLRNHLAGEAGL